MGIQHLLGLYRAMKRRRAPRSIDISGATTYTVCRQCCPDGGRYRVGTPGNTPGYVWSGEKQRRCPNHCVGGLLPSA